MDGSCLQTDVTQQIPLMVVHERMSQSEEVSGTKEKKKVKGWSTEEMQDKPNSLGRHRRNEDMERYNSGGHGSMLEEVGRERMRKRFWTSTRSRTAKEAYRGRCSSLEWWRVRKSRKYRIRKWREDGWAIIFALFRNTTCSVCKACMRIRLREKTAQNEGCERYDQENQIKRENGC